MSARISLLFLLLLEVCLKVTAQQNTNYLAILKGASKYNINDNRALPEFTYESSNDPQLVALRKKFKLDSVAGFGNEISRLINLLHWVHNNIHHDGQHESGIYNKNANDIIDVSRKTQIGVSCGELASVLNDCYLAMGWHSRKVYCFPKDSLGNDPDSHVINIVYCASQKKWLWVDPTNDAYVMDEKGNLLSIEEVRERLINNRQLIVNPDANWNHRSSTEKPFYLEFYMAKNLYQLYCPARSEYDYESQGKHDTIAYIHLLPLDYSKQKPDQSKRFSEYLKMNVIDYRTNNAALFWKSPEN
jgi:hypothetical protein